MGDFLKSVVGVAFAGIILIAAAIGVFSSNHHLRTSAIHLWLSLVVAGVAFLLAVLLERAGLNMERHMGLFLLVTTPLFFIVLISVCAAFIFGLAVAVSA